MLEGIDPQEAAEIKSECEREAERLERNAWRMMIGMFIRNGCLIFLALILEEIIDDEMALFVATLIGCTTSVAGIFWSIDYIRLHNALSRQMDVVDSAYMADFRSSELNSMRRRSPVLTLNLMHSCGAACAWMGIAAMAVLEM